MLSLPIEKVWYRKLLFWSIFIGILGGFSALLYTVVTDGPITLIFGDITTDYWSGSWWWIPLVAIGGLIVVWLRKKWKIEDDLPSAIDIAKESLIDRKIFIKLVTISAISLIFGASLGPSYGIILLAGGFASVIFSKLKISKNIEIEKEYTRAGMSGGLGAVFATPILGTLFSLELSPSKKDPFASTLPRLIAATFGFIVFFAFVGTLLIDSYKLPDYSYETIDLFYGLVCGIFAILVLFGYRFINVITDKGLSITKNSYSRGVLGGAIVGLIAFFVPLTLGAGNSQLSYATQNFGSFTLGFVLLVLILKIFAISISQKSGFIGGNVFPIIFVGGISGFILHLIFPEIPLALAVSSLMAAVPGATLTAPLSIVLVATGGVGLGITSVPPIIVAVIIAQLGLVSLRAIQRTRDTNEKI